MRSSGGEERREKSKAAEEVGVALQQSLAQRDERKEARWVPGMFNNNKIHLFVPTCGSDAPLGIKKTF